MTVRCAVLGRPVSHSLSPVMHRAAHDALGLQGWTYEKFDLGEDEVADFVRGLDGSWRGLSVTMPLKRAVAAALDEVGETAAEVGAVNTVTLHDGRRLGENTDVPGAVDALAEYGVDSVADGAIVGAGATAASLIAALRRLGLSRVTILARDPGRAESLARLARSWGVAADTGPLDAPLGGRLDVLASTVPASSLEPYVPELVSHAAAVFDVIYDPWPTGLAAAAERRGVPVVSGLDLLAHQAARQVELFTGRSVPASLLRDAARSAL